MYPNPVREEKVLMGKYIGFQRENKLLRTFVLVLKHSVLVLSNCEIFGITKWDLTVVFRNGFIYI